MKIYVDNLPYRATGTDLKRHFEQYGKVTAATINLHQSGPHQGKSNGSGMVVMENRQDGERAIAALNNQEMMGRPLRVKEDQPAGHQSPSEKTLSTGDEHDYFRNPYTFVPTPPRPTKGFAGDFNPLKQGLDHATLKEGCWTGHIPIKLTTVTPLVLLKNDGTERDPKKHQIYDVLDFLPESSLRGMLRSAYEVVTNSRYGCFGNDDRLAYRMNTDAALKLIPAVIENGNKQGTLKARLYPGTSFATDEGPDGAGELGATYAAMLTRYSDKVRQSKCAANYTPRTGDEVWAEIVLCQHEVSQRNRDHYSNDYRFWKVVMVWPKAGNPNAPAPTGGTPWYSNRQTPNRDRRQSYYAPLDPEDRRVVEGCVLITNQNMGNKHDERIFFDPIPSTTLTHDVTEDIEKAWQMRIKSYRDAHSENEMFGRPGATNQPWKKIGNKPGQTAWSPHLYQDGRKNGGPWGTHDVADLRPGDMVYARCEFSGNTITGIADLFPVMISRELYANSPADLLDSSLKPAKVRNELSPADRLFGWVPQEQGDDSGYKSRIRIVCEDRPRPKIIQRFDGDTFPLTILGQPKPAQGRFYVANNKGEPQHGKDKVAAGYDASQGKSLRGRKQYWHHKGLEAELTENKQTECYWQPSTEDRTQVKRKGRYQEYRRPDKDGNPQRDPQNRSIKGWIKPCTEFRVSLYLQNLQPEEIGALLWLLSLPEKHYFKLGYGKPLGFGSVRLEVDSGVLPLGTGKDWEKYYAMLDADLPATLDAGQRGQCIQAFQTSMTVAYNANGSFEDIPFISDFLQILEGPMDDLPIHYPRLKRQPTPEGENFRWFTENEKERGGWKEALPDFLDQEEGLPYEPYD